MSTRIAGVLIPLVLVFGCGRSQTPREPQTPDQLKGRLDAATKITNSTERNEALQTIAEDAADAGISEIVIKALEGITNSSTRNDVAADCALRLAKKGETKGATTVAEGITNSTKRNEVLGKIAKGGP